MHYTVQYKQKMLNVSLCRATRLTIFRWLILADYYDKQTLYARFKNTYEWFPFPLVKAIVEPMAAILYRERKTKTNPTDDTTVLNHRNLSFIRLLQNSYGLFDRLFISERNGNDCKAST